MDPRALTELLPQWKEQGAPLDQPVTSDRFLFLTEGGARGTPEFLLPDCFKNHGNYVISLGNLVRWMAQQAEAVGVEIFPGFAAAEVLFDASNAVKGVATGNVGIGKNGEPTESFQLGMELHGKYTIFAEGSRGSLGKRLIDHYRLAAGKDPQSYGIGLKELWEIDPKQHDPGLVVHTAGWPLDPATYGGSFLYHLDKGQLEIGFVVGLDYANPWLNPFEEFQRWKTHPAIAEILAGGRRVSYGARAINEGGWQSVPKLAFPGGALIGCAAGFVNVPRIKGTHTAMKSGMLAAEAVASAIAAGEEKNELSGYAAAVRSSWIADELSLVKNAQPLVAKFGGALGTLFAGLDMWLRTLKLRLPFTMKHHTDAEETGRADLYRPIAYPKPDGRISFDRLSSVFLSGTNHEEDQPCHLVLKDPTVPERINWPLYAGPEARYCPAGVYEYVGVEEGEPRLVINAQNCVHCKTCDIKDPIQNIEWVTPEGGGGPNYPNM
jgi:electron-transferring-flavoprotein dehydrogenase